MIHNIQAHSIQANRFSIRRHPDAHSGFERTHSYDIWSMLVYLFLGVQLLGWGQQLEAMNYGELFTKRRAKKEIARINKLMCHLRGRCFRVCRAVNFLGDSGET